jgi:tyrosine-specific transport protein
MHKDILGAALLVSGTTIGAAVLALPIALSATGLLTSCLVFFGIWLLMLYTALLIYEANLYVPIGSHFQKMAKKTLGQFGALVTGLIYLGLLYALMVAYLQGLCDMTTLPWLTDHLILKLVIWCIALFVILWVGMRSIDQANRILMYGLFGSFIVLTIILLPSSNQPINWTINQPQAAIPIVLTAFGYHVIIPTLRSHLANQPTSATIYALCFGSLAPLLLYTLWTYTIFASVPISELITINHQPQPLNHLSNYLINHLQLPGINWLIDGFILCAIVSSLLGVSKSLFDFLKDIVPSHTKIRTWCCTLTVIPPMLGILWFKDLFLAGLQYGGYCVLALLVLLPAAMVISGRLKGLHHNISFRTPAVWLFCPIIIVSCFGFGYWL